MFNHLHFALAGGLSTIRCSNSIERRRFWLQSRRWRLADTLATLKVLTGKL
jgi:hypothetical protein